MKLRIFFATLFSFIAFVLLLVGFLSSSPKATALGKVYFFKIDASDIATTVSSAVDSATSAAPSGVQDAISAAKDGDWSKAEEAAKGSPFEDAVQAAKDGDTSSLQSMAGSALNGKRDNNSKDNKKQDLTFSIGTSGYCLNFDKCFSDHTPFYFDFQGAVKKATGLEIPDDLKTYQTAIKYANQAIWVMSLISMICMLATVVTGVVTFLMTCCSKVAFVARLPAVITVFLSVIGFICSLGAAGVASGLYTIAKNKLNEYTGNFAGIDASMGASGLALYWISVVVTLVCAINWGATSRASKRQIAYRAPNMVEAGPPPHNHFQHKNDGYMPPQGYAESQPYGGAADYYNHHPHNRY